MKKLKQLLQKHQKHVLLIIIVLFLLLLGVFAGVSFLKKKLLGYEGNIISSALSNIVEDTTPQLGGNLDGQSYNITTTGSISSSNASSTLLSAFQAWFGQSATSTFGTDGLLTMAANINLSGNDLIRISDAFIIDSLAVPTSTNPTVDAGGEIAINSTSASTSIRFYDGTAERALYDIIERTLIISSSTLDNYAGATVSSTIELGFASVHGETWNELHCITDAGTAEIEFGDGTNWMDYQLISSTKTSDTSLSNNTFTMGEERFVRVGQTSGFNTLACTAVIRINAD